MRIVHFIIASMLVLSFETHAGLTQQCNTGASSQIYLYGMNAATQSRIVAAVTQPATDAELYARLWEPRKAEPVSTSLSNLMVILHMEPFQDLSEMIAAMRSDPQITALGISGIGDNGGVCLAALPVPMYQRVTEYHNTLLNHYFLSSTTQENESIDSGAAGPGWVRTGESFLTIPPDVCYGSQRVFRFYGPQPNSHFYTSDTNECGNLRKPESGWNPEGIAFGATLPQLGQCPDSSYTPVYRLYNNRWKFNDSNHRYTIRTDIYQQMIGNGWIGEGVAFCVRDGK